MCGLMREIYRLDGPPVYASAGDLDWWRSDEPEPDLLKAQLWFDDQKLLGLAWPSGEQVDIMTHPAARHLEADILDWAETQRRTMVVDQSGTIRAWSFMQDKQRQELLLSRGYTLQPLALQFRTRPMLELPVAPTLAAGYRIRAVRLPEEIDARIEVHRDAFAPSRMTRRRYEVVARMPSYRMDLDLVAEAPDGSLAAFCIVWWDAENRMGVFEPVGCHSAHRQRGLASAVMIAGLHRLADLGATAAHVCSLRGSVAAEALYATLGFRVSDENEAYDLVL